MFSQMNQFYYLRCVTKFKEDLFSRNKQTDLSIMFKNAFVSYTILIKEKHSMYFCLTIEKYI